MTKVIIVVRGGLVESVYADGDVEVEVFDLDVSDFPDDVEQEEANAKEAQVDEIVKQEGWKNVW